MLHSAVFRVVMLVNNVGITNDRVATSNVAKVLRQRPRLY